MQIQIIVLEFTRRKKSYTSIKYWPCLCLFAICSYDLAASLGDYLIRRFVYLQPNKAVSASLLSYAYDVHRWVAV